MLMFLLLIANSFSSPPGPSLGGVKLGSPLPSGFSSILSSFGTPVKNEWCRQDSIGGIPGRLDVTVCNGVVHSITFGANDVSAGTAHMIWATALKASGFESPVPYNYCTDETGFMCSTFWKNQSNGRTIHMMWYDDGTPTLTESLDGPCLEGI